MVMGGAKPLLKRKSDEDDCLERHVVKESEAPASMGHEASVMTSKEKHADLRLD